METKLNNSKQMMHEIEHMKWLPNRTECLNWVHQEEKYGTMNPLFLIREGSLIPKKLELSLSNDEFTMMKNSQGLASQEV